MTINETGVESKSIGARTAEGAAWTGLAFVANKGVLLLSTVVLARLLTPVEFGIVAIALVVVGYVERLSEGGLESAIISFPGDDQKCFDHALGLSLALGSGFLILGVLSAPLIAVVFDEPEVAPVVAVLSVLYLSTSIRQMLSGAMARRMQFGRRVIPELIRAVVKAGVMISLAFAGWGVWALTIGHVVGAVVGVAAFWLALGTRITPRFTAETSRPLLRFGGAFSLVAVLGTVIQNADYVMIGLRADSAAVGLYTIGFRIPELTVLAVPAIASQSLIAGFVRLSESASELRRAYLSSLGMLSAILMPLGLGLVLCSDDAVGLLFGDQWEEAGPVAARLGLFALISGITFPFGDVLKATGRASLLVRIAVVRLVITLPLLWVAAGQGLVAVANAHVLASGFLIVLSAVLASRMFGADVRSQVLAVLPPLMAGIVMVCAVLAVRSMLEPGALRLLAAVAVGAGVYALSMALLDRPLLIKARALVLPSRG